MKKLITVLAVALVVALALVALAGCEGESSSSAEEPITIGIIQIVEHPALDAAREGFIAGMADAGFVDGENVIFDYQNAQGDHNTLSTIADRFVSREVDLVLAVATPSAQAIAMRTDSIPVIGTAITSYTRAELVDSDEVPGGNITGTTDMNPVKDQILLGLDLVPNAQTVGLIYSSQEANSVYQIEIAKNALAELGLDYEDRTVENTNEVQQAMASLVRTADFIFIPTDNVIASAMAIVADVANTAGVPTICGEINMVKSGGFATMGIDYFDLGVKAASMAVEVLEGADPATMPIQTVPGDEITINEEVVEILGISIPERFQGYVQALEPPE